MILARKLLTCGVKQILLIRFNLIINIQECFINFMCASLAYMQEIDPHVQTETWRRYEPRCEKTGLRDFRPGLTQTGLYSYRR